MNSEKVKEIKKNIIICSNKIECKGCSLFPNMKSTNCRNKLLADALTLINELESENERFVESCKNCHYIKDLEIANGHAQELKDRIAELGKENALIKNSVAMRDYKTLEEISNNKVKQFAEMLKEKMNVREYMGVKYKQGVFSENDIDDILKEYEE